MTEPKFYSKLTKKYPYEKIFFSPAHPHYFLFIDSEPSPWLNKEGGLGVWTPCESINVNNSEDKNCLGVMICSRADLGTVVHECSHAAFAFVMELTYNNPAFDALDDFLFSEILDEWFAFSTGLTFEQVANLTTIDKIRKDYIPVSKRKTRKKVQKIVR